MDKDVVKRILAMKSIDEVEGLLYPIRDATKGKLSSSQIAKLAAKHAPLLLGILQKAPKAISSVNMRTAASIAIETIAPLKSRLKCKPLSLETLSYQIISAAYSVKCHDFVFKQSHLLYCTLKEGNSKSKDAPKLICGSIIFHISAAIELGTLTMDQVFVYVTEAQLHNETLTDPPRRSKNEDTFFRLLNNASSKLASSNTSSICRAVEWSMVSLKTLDISTLVRAMISVGSKSSPKHSVDTYSRLWSIFQNNSRHFTDESMSIVRFGVRFIKSLVLVSRTQYAETVFEFLVAFVNAHSKDTNYGEAVINMLSIFNQSLLFSDSDTSRSLLAELISQLDATPPTSIGKSVLPDLSSYVYNQYEDYLRSISSSVNLMQEGVLCPHRLSHPLLSDEIASLYGVLNSHIISSVNEKDRSYLVDNLLRRVQLVFLSSDLDRVLACLGILRECYDLASQWELFNSVPNILTMTMNCIALLRSRSSNSSEEFHFSKLGLSLAFLCSTTAHGRQSLEKCFTLIAEHFKVNNMWSEGWNWILSIRKVHTDHFECFLKPAMKFKLDLLLNCRDIRLAERLSTFTTSFEDVPSTIILELETWLQISFNVEDSPIVNEATARIISHCLSIKLEQENDIARLVLLAGDYYIFHRMYDELFSLSQDYLICVSNDSSIVPVCMYLTSISNWKKNTEFIQSFEVFFLWLQQSNLSTGDINYSILVTCAITLCDICTLAGLPDSKLKFLKSLKHFVSTDPSMFQYATAELEFATLNTLGHRPSPERVEVSSLCVHDFWSAFAKLRQYQIHGILESISDLKSYVLELQRTDEYRGLSYVGFDVLSETLWLQGNVLESIYFAEAALGFWKSVTASRSEENRFSEFFIAMQVTKLAHRLGAAFQHIGRYAKAKHFYTHSIECSRKFSEVNYGALCSLLLGVQLETNHSTSYQVELELLRFSCATFAEFWELASRIQGTIEKFDDEMNLNYAIERTLFETVLAAFLSDPEHVKAGQRDLLLKVSQAYGCKFYECQVATLIGGNSESVYALSSLTRDSLATKRECFKFLRALKDSEHTKLTALVHLEKGTALRNEIMLRQTRLRLSNEKSLSSDVLDSLVGSMESLSIDNSSTFGFHPNDINTSVKEMLVGVNLLPQYWSVCTIDLIESCLVLTRISKSHDPISVKLEGTTLPEHLSTFAQLMEKANDNIHGGVGIVGDAKRKHWYDDRVAMDRQLYELLHEIQRDALGCWQTFLMGSVKSSRLLDSVNKSSLGPIELEYLFLAINSGLSLSTREIEAILSKVYGRKRKNRLTVADVRDISKAYENSERGPVILVLGDGLHQLPWECLPCLRDSTCISRMPSLSFVFAKLQGAMGKTDACFQGIDARLGYYVVNPSKDLTRTEEVFGCRFRQIDEWEGVIGEEPSITELQTALSTRDVYIYCGHNGGQKYLSINKLEAQSINSASMLLGCSSGVLKQFERYDSDGVCLAYLLSGCPAVVGNLWDVTDGDIDRFGMKLVQTWLEKGGHDTLAQSVAESRNACKLRYLIGCSPVCYGLPVKISNTLS